MFGHDMKYVFFSYRRDDAEELVRRIERVSLGMIAMRHDLSLLTPGRPWQPQLENEIARADVLVFVISPGSVAAFEDHSAREALHK